MKGQITVYMMIGLVILISLGVMSYIYSSAAEEEAGRDVEESLLAVYQGQQQTQDLVQTCLQQIVHEGVSIMRLQGGFINIPEDFKTLPLFTDYDIYTETIDDVQHKHIRDKENSIVFVPYYVTKEDGLMVPSLAMLEDELEGYIEKELKVCVGGLEPIADQMKIDIRDGSVNATVQMGKSIVVTGNYDISGKTDRLEWVAKDFAYEIPVDIAKMHNYSLNIAALEMYDVYLEDHIKKVISLNKYGGTGPKGEYDLPPFSEPVYSFDPTYETWSVAEVKQKVKTLLMATFPMLKMANTRFEMMEFEDEIVQGTYNSFIKNYFPEDNLTSIHLNYDRTWPSEIDVNPKEGGTLKPHVEFGPDYEGIPSIPMPSSIDYQFKYDVKIPVLTTVRDYWSVYINASNLNVDGNGINFYFVMEAFLCGNQVRKCNPPVDYDSIISDMGLEGTGTGESKFCTVNRTTPVKIKIINSVNNIPVPNTAIRYSCANSAACFMGMTNSSGIVETEFPNCLNGELFIQKYGYKEIERLLTVEDELELEIGIEPLKELSISTKGVDMHKFAIYHYMTDGFTRHDCNGNSPDALLEDTYFDLQRSDSITGKLEGKGGNLIKETILYPEIDNITMASGTYELNMNYMQNATIVPSFYPTEDGGLWVGYAGEAPEYDTYQGKWPMGTLTYEIELPDVQGAEEIMFYVPAEYPPQVLEVKDMENISMRNDHVEFEFRADKDCDGTPEFINYVLTSDHYKRFLSPELK